MAESRTPDPQPSIWVGYLMGRLVVFDPSIQPSNQDYVLLYFVQGQALCMRKRADERVRVKSVRNPYEREYALAQYAKWASTNASLLTQKSASANFDVEDPPPPRKICSECEGEGSWHYTVGSFADGAHSDGQNFRETCSSCRGRGSVENVVDV